MISTAYNYAAIMTREAARYCLFLWSCLFLLFLADLAMIGIWCPKIKKTWIRVVMVVGGIIFIFALPLMNLVLGCGLV
jgi:hypothetical protein